MGVLECTTRTGTRRSLCRRPSTRARSTASTTSRTRTCIHRQGPVDLYPRGGEGWADDQQRGATAQPAGRDGGRAAHPREEFPLGIDALQQLPRARLPGVPHVWRGREPGLP